MGGLTGLGATEAAWKTVHREDSRSAPGAAYDPDPSVGRGSPRFNDRYYGVLVEDGRIFGYEMRFPPETAVSEARRYVLASEFPPDARIDWFHRRGTCAQMQVRSRKLSRAADGVGFVEFSSGAAADAYDPEDVWSAILMVTTPAKRAAAPGC
jgi:hypothetical protein